jgi:hypothetical protein
MPGISFARVSSRKGRVLGITSVIVGIALAAGMAGPASAAPPPTTPPPAFSAWLADSSVSSSAAQAPATRSALAGPSLVKPAALVGKRTTFTRGSSLAWSSDTFEWYWSGSSMSSSTAWQADGYIFPNTVTLQGVKRTLATAGQHNWRGTATIGAGVVTPWGAVDVYQTTTTDYFSLTPGGGFSHSS